MIASLWSTLFSIPRDGLLGKRLCPLSPPLPLLLAEEITLLNPILFPNPVVHQDIPDHRHPPKAIVKAIELASENPAANHPSTTTLTSAGKVQASTPHRPLPAPLSQEGPLWAPDSLSSPPALPTSEQNLGWGQGLPCAWLFCPESQTLLTDLGQGVQTSRIWEKIKFNLLLWNLSWQPEQSTD